MLPTPNELFAQFERGEIERDELQAMMSLHARELIREMEDDYQNPAAALIETFLARRAVAKLTKIYPEKQLREILRILAGLPESPFAHYWWNADHPDVPLHCYLRMRREPVLRIVEIEENHGLIKVKIQHGSAKKRETQQVVISLTRDGSGALKAFKHS